MISGYGAYVTINGAEATGTVLLLAAAPVGKGRLMEATSVIPALAAIPPSAWTGTSTVTLVELADPVEPQAVLTRLRSAAAAEGPLTVVLIGQLHRDRRQQIVHLALGHTTAPTLRYTALPWTWLVHELQQRRPDTTTVYADLVADAEVWEQLLVEPLDFGRGTKAYGTINPPPRRRHIAQPRYATALAQILRTGRRPHPAELHDEAVRQAVDENTLPFAAEQPAGTPAPVVQEPARPTLPPQAPRSVSPVYVPSTRVIPVAGDPHEPIRNASKAGRHKEAAQLAAVAEQRARQQYGPGTLATIHWTEVRAFVAGVAEDHAASCALWTAAAEARLTVARQPTNAPDVEQAVDWAQQHWHRIADPSRALELSAALLQLREQVTSRQPDALPALQKKLQQLQTA